MNKSIENQLVVLGETNFRNQRWRFGIKQDDRRRHMYVVGSTGMGKSEFLKNMAIQDIEVGRGIAFIDPHGDSADDLLDHIPAERIKDVVYFDPGDLAYPIAFNVMEKVGFEFRHLVASGLLGVFKKIFGVEVWSGRMEYILNNTILALLEYPDATLLGINRMLSDKEYRNKVIANLTDPIVKSFWINEFAKYTDRYMQEATPAIQNKIGQFISNNLIRNIIGQVHSTIDIRKIMDDGKVLIVNLSRGKIGEDASRLLGALLVTKIQLAAMSRVDIPESSRRDFYLYVDEFQHFATESFANILSEARKYHLSLIMAHQYIKQMEEPVMDAVFGNVGTIISFRVGAEDGEFLEKWFQPDFMMNDIINLGKYNIYLKLMIDGVSSKGFSAVTIPPFPKLEQSNRDAILDFSRRIYATSREIVEKKIAEWAGMGSVQNSLAEVPRQMARDSSRFGGMSETSHGMDSQQPRTDQKPDQYRGRVPERGAFQGQIRPFDNAQGRPSQRFDRPRSSYQPVPERRFEAPRFQEPKIQPRPTAAEPRLQTTNPEQQQAPYNNKLYTGQAVYGAGDLRQTTNDKRPERTQFFNRAEEKPGLQGKPGSQPQYQRPRPFDNAQGRRLSGLPLNEAFRGGPVNFRGRKVDERKERPKVEVNTEELKKALEEAMKGND